MNTVQIRYIVNDVDAAIAFYTRHLGFHEEMHPAPTFAMLSRGDLRLVLSAPSAPNTGGGSALPDGRKPEPGGWNRFAIQVDDLAALMPRLQHDGVRFRTKVIEGVGGRQAIIEDPSGNPVELFEPIRPEARLSNG
ncbi:VOC family protein [Sinomonas humi]|uniref:Glyoxalase n=1 Tax=Sinomonas humi TaxID=1338436 RepID=A0A0B2AKU2_9MICC|nr:VOC family protein [Sinomonas humi]KHL02402.1 glyoxalase [Sinomonas humi]